MKENRYLTPPTGVTNYDDLFNPNVKQWKANGWKKPGRKKKHDYDKIRSLLSENKSLSEVARIIPCAVGTVWAVKHNKIVGEKL